MRIHEHPGAFNLALDLRRVDHPSAHDTGTAGSSMRLGDALSGRQTALARLAQADVFRATAAELEAKLATVLADWANITKKPVAQQRQLLRKLVPDRITVTPHVTAKRKWIDWAGDLAVAPIISGIAPAVGDVMPDDPMDRRWWPQRDSNPCFSLERAVS